MRVWQSGTDVLLLFEVRIYCPSIIKDSGHIRFNTDPVSCDITQMAISLVHVIISTLKGIDADIQEA